MKLRPRLVWVEMKFDSPDILRIFKSKKAAFASRFPVREMVYADAVANIRHQLFIRSKGFCEDCGSVITENSMEMHERQWRGKGGEISLDNSIAACNGSHKFAHRERAPKFTRRIQP